MKDAMVKQHHVESRESTFASPLPSHFCPGKLVQDMAISLSYHVAWSGKGKLDRFLEMSTV